MLETPQPIPTIPKQQDIYQRIKLLGSGSFGKAYLVQQKQTGQQYVIKQIDLSQLSQKQQQNTKTQAKLLQILDHPNIVKFKQIYTTSKMKLNIVMEYADGGDLAGMIKDIKSKGMYMEEDQVLDLFTQICLGVKHMHDRKITHRDLKGQNVFLTESGCVKIGDLGVARVLEHTVAKAKTVVGSPYYMSPQIVQNKPYSFKTDIWSLGVILYQMCALQPPFTANNIQFLALKIVRGAYQNIPQNYSSDLKTLIKSMLSTNVNQRPNINQILSCPLINRRIKSLLTQSQNNKQFSHTVIHKFNALKGKIEDKLRPPPNLMEIQQENQNISAGEMERKMLDDNYEKEKEREREVKAKTPYCYGKNAPPIKKKIVISEKRIRPNTAQDLNQIMKIKPSQLQQHIAIPKLPKVSPNPLKKKPQQKLQFIARPQTPKQIPSYQSQKIVIKKGATSSAFNKKKSIDCAQYCKQEKGKQNVRKIQIKTKQVMMEKGDGKGQNEEKCERYFQSQEIHNKSRIQQVEELGREGKQSCKEDKQYKEIQNISNNFGLKKNTEPISKIKLELNEKDKVSHHIQKQDKKDVKKPLRIAQKQKTSKPSKPKQKKQDKKQSNLQLVSQQMKAKQKQQKKKATGHHGAHKKVIQKKPKSQQISKKPKKQTQQRTNNSEAGLEQVFQQQKCNNASDTYQEEQFQVYEDKDKSGENSEMSFQLSDSSMIGEEEGKDGEGKSKNDYKKMLAELELITKLVDEAKGKADSLPVLGTQIPQHLKPEPQPQIRLDDTTLQHHLTKLSSQLLTKTQSCLNNLACIGDQSQLQNLRMALQQIFGVKNIIKAYRYLENVVEKSQLDFNQEEVIRGLLKECKEIQEGMLRRHFRLIVTVIVMENQAVNV